MITVTRQLPSRLAALLISCVAGALCTAAQATDSDEGVWTIFSTTDAFSSGDEASRWHYWFDNGGDRVNHLGVLNFKMKL